MPDPFDLPPPERERALLRPPPRATWRERVERRRRRHRHHARPAGRRRRARWPSRWLLGALADTAGRAAAGGRAPVRHHRRGRRRPPPSPPRRPSELVVHVAGAVLQPGVHAPRQPAPAWSTRSTRPAGWPRTADGARLNLAAPSSDGERVYVPAVGEEPPPVVGGRGAGRGRDAGGGGSGRPQHGRRRALDALPGVGPATAAAIIEHRERDRRVHLRRPAARRARHRRGQARAAPAARHGLTAWPIAGPWPSLAAAAVRRAAGPSRGARRRRRWLLALAGHLAAAARAALPRRRRCSPARWRSGRWTGSTAWPRGPWPAR